MMTVENVMVPGGQPLLDGVDIGHGSSHEPLCRFFPIAQSLARLSGVEVRVHEDLSTLVAANAKLQTSWGPIVPTFNPAESALSKETAFWLSAHDQSGALVATCAARRFDVAPGGFVEEFTSLRLFYANPAAHLAKGTYCTIEGDARRCADRFRRTVTFSGSHWTRPDFRRRGIVYILARVSRNLGIARWDSDFTVGVTRVDLAAKQALEPYGYRNSDRLISVRNSYRGDFDMSLIWMDRPWMEAELRDYVTEQASKLDRVTEAEDTKTPERVSQGSMMRS